VPESPPPLAEQARGVRWWLRAVRRSPLLLSLLIVQFFAVPIVSSFWEPPWWVHFVLWMPIAATVGQIAQRAARTLEFADESAERTGRRRPLGAPSPEDHPVTFTWRSATGRRVLQSGVGLIIVMAAGIAMVGYGFAADPPGTAGDLVLEIVLIGLIVITLGLSLVSTGRLAGSCRRIAAEPGDRVLMEAIGFDPSNQQWVLKRLDNGKRLSVTLLGGKRLLVAGDELLAAGAITVPVRNWRQWTHAPLALTSEFGTLWAFHGSRVRSSRRGSGRG
jgi:hypothetical protein